MSARDHEMQIRFGDMDAFGHMNNAVYFSYLEDVRLRMYREPEGPGGADLMSMFAAIGARPVVGAQRIDYRVEVSMDVRGPLIGRVWVSRLGRTSHTVGFALLSADRSIVHAVAESVVVQVDLATGAARPLTEEQTAVLAAWRDEPVVFRS